MPVTEQIVLNALKTVQDPELHKDLVTLNMVKAIQVTDNQIAIKVELTTPACPMKDQIRNDIETTVATAAIDAGTPDPEVHVEFSADVRSPQQRVTGEDNPLPNVKNIIAVGAGKGGVGKSTVAVNLAVALAKFGTKVGLLDGDIYGPSLPTMLGISGQQPTIDGELLNPFEAHGIKAMTIGAMVQPDQPLIWRGPMAHGAFKQLATQTNWGELDYLIIDLPPGTGDVPLSLAQMLPLTGAVVVCTPQKVAVDDARRAVRMFEQLDITVLGIVENMSSFICEHGTEYDIFGKGGSEALAREMGIATLGNIPITPSLGVNCDQGTPLANFDDTNPKLAEALTTLAQNFAAQVSVASMQHMVAKPTMSIS